MKLNNLQDRFWAWVSRGVWGAWLELTPHSFSNVEGKTK